jgi:hypothetical protein
MIEQHWVLIHLRVGTPFAVTCDSGDRGLTRLRKAAEALAKSLEFIEATDDLRLYLVLAPGEMSQAQVFNPKQVQAWRAKPATP